MPRPWQPPPPEGPSAPPWSGPAGSAAVRGPDGKERLRIWLRLRGERVLRCAVWTDGAWFSGEEARLLGAMVELRRAAPPLLTAEEIERELGPGAEPGRAEAASRAMDEALRDWMERHGGPGGRVRAVVGELRDALAEVRGEPSYRAYKLR